MRGEGTPAPCPSNKSHLIWDATARRSCTPTSACHGTDRQWRTKSSACPSVKVGRVEVMAGGNEGSRPSCIELTTGSKSRARSMSDPHDARSPDVFSKATASGMVIDASILHDPNQLPGFRSTKSAVDPTNQPAVTCNPICALAHTFRVSKRGRAGGIEANALRRACWVMRSWACDEGRWSPRFVAARASRAR